MRLLREEEGHFVIIMDRTKEQINYCTFSVDEYAVNWTNSLNWGNNGCFASLSPCYILVSAKLVAVVSTNQRNYGGFKGMPELILESENLYTKYTPSIK